MKDVSTLHNELKKYIKTEDEKTLKMIHAMLKGDQESDWWDDLSDAAKASIERGLKDAEAGRVTSHEIVIKKYKK